MTANQDLSGRAFQLWHDAMRWQRTVNAALRSLELTHSQFLVLDAAERGWKATGDALSQRQIAELAGLDESTTCRISARLATRGLLDRGVSGGEDERPWRIFVPECGKLLLRRARPLVTAAAERFWERCLYSAERRAT